MLRSSTPSLFELSNAWVISQSNQHANQPLRLFGRYSDGLARLPDAVKCHTITAHDVRRIGIGVPFCPQAQCATPTHRQSRNWPVKRSGRARQSAHAQIVIGLAFAGREIGVNVDNAKCMFPRLSPVDPASPDQSSDRCSRVSRFVRRRCNCSEHRPISRRRGWHCQANCPEWLSAMSRVHH